MEQNKEILRAKFDEAKQLGMRVNAARSTMNGIKAQLEQSQIKRAMDQMDHTQTAKENVGGSALSQEEERLRADIEREKTLYRDHYVALKEIKVEIDHMKCMLKKNRKQIQIDFENWWSLNRLRKQDDDVGKVVKKTTVITGDAVADKNIAEFYKMREQILDKMQ